MPYFTPDDQLTVASAGQPCAGPKLVRPGWGTASWAGGGAVLAVHEFTIRQPFVFVGKTLPARWGAAIDLSLPACADGLAARPGAATYAQMTSRQRHGFLRWLSTGRNQELSDDAALRVFLAGVEEYLLAPRAPGADAAEVDELLIELRRLSKRYGSAHWQAAAQCLALHDFCRLQRVESLGNRAYEDNGFVQIAATPPSPGLRFALGQLSSDNKKLPARWAFQWARCYLTRADTLDLDMYGEPLRRLFVQRYVQTFGEGISLPKECFVQLECGYEPLNPGLYGREFVLRGGATLRGPWPAATKPLALLVSQCRADLNDYIAHRKTGAAEAECWAFLPVALWPEDRRNALRGLVQSALESPVVSCYSELAPFFRLPEISSMRQIVRLGERLAEFGLTAFPAFCAVDRPRKAEDPFAIFALDATGADTDPLTPAFKLVLRLCAMDFEPRGAEWPRIHAGLARHAQATSGLGRGTRLVRQSRLLLLPYLAGKAVTTKELACLSEASLAQARALMSDLVASVDLLPATPRIDKLLGPSWRAALPAGLVLNIAKVRELETETRQVHALLSGVFLDTAASDPLPVPAAVCARDKDGASAPSRKSGMHKFVAALQGREVWAPSEIAALAKAQKLMAAGALEWANDASYDFSGAPLLEEEESGWRVNAAALEAVLRSSCFD